MSAVFGGVDTCGDFLCCARNAKGNKRRENHRKNDFDNCAVLRFVLAFDDFQVRRHFLFCGVLLSRILCGADCKSGIFAPKLFGDNTIFANLYPRFFGDDNIIERTDKFIVTAYFLFVQFQNFDDVQKQFCDNNQVCFGCFCDKYRIFHALVFDFCKNISSLRLLTE